MKPKKYWLKGGMVGLIILVLMVVSSFYRPLEFLAVPYLLILLLTLSIAADLGLDNFYYFVSEPISPFPHPTLLGTVTAIVIALIIFFILGMLGGYIYGKIKSRNQP